MTGAGAVVNTAGVRPGNSVAIFGVGGVGLSAVAAAAAVSADPIIAVDLDASKLEFARAFGATHVIDASETERRAGHPGPDLEAWRIDAPPKHGGGTDFAFDCIGVPATMSQILEAVRWSRYGDEDGGGVAVLVGVPMTTIELDTRAIESGEKIYRGSRGGSCRPERDFPMFLRWFQEGKLDLERLVTRRFRLEDINEATEALEARPHPGPGDHRVRRLSSTGDGRRRSLRQARSASRLALADLGPRPVRAPAVDSGAGCRLEELFVEPVVVLAEQ